MSHALDDVEFRSLIADYNQKTPLPPAKFERGWSDKMPFGQERMSLEGLYGTLNNPHHFATPALVIDVVMHCVRERGISALEEPANVYRLQCCDEKARKEIESRVAALRRRS